MSTLWAASLRHLVRHPAQLALALIGLALGVATIVAVDIATASSRRAFELSMQAVNGSATHQIVSGPQGIDERLYVELRTRVGRAAEAQPALAPVVEGYVTAGDRTLQLVGIDPFASAKLETAPLPIDAQQLPPARGQSAAQRGGPTAQPGESTAQRGGSAAQPSPSAARRAQSAVEPDRLAALRKWLIEPGAVIMAAGTARELGLATDRRFEVDVGGVRHSALLIGQLREQRAGYDALLLTDIAQAQEWLGMAGRLSRIDVRIPDGRAGQAALAVLREELPPDVQLHAAKGRTRESLDMTSAFTTNLKAMSLLALLVSTLLIYGAISFAVVQRRRIIGILRALGATRSGVLAIVLTEAAVLGFVGAGLGLLLGVAIGRELIRLVSQTINDLYFVVAVNDVALPYVCVAKALLAGLGTALVAALLPALEVAASTPQLGLRRSVLEERAVNLARRLLIVSGALAAAAGVIVLVSGRSLLAGFVALFMLLLSVAALTPAVLRALAQAAARLAGRASPAARLAFADVAASLSRTGVAVAALGMAVAAMIGVSVMVGSFRESLREWLVHTMRADIYVTAPGPGSEPERRLEPQVIGALLATPGVADHSERRTVVVESPSGAVPLDALKLIAASHAGLQLTEGDARHVWADFEKGDIIISEPLAWRLRLRQGDTLTLSTALGPRALRIAAVYREYGNDRGNVLMTLSEYRRLWHDEGLTGLGIYLAPGAQPARVMAALREAVRGRQALLIRSNADLRAISMSIFERTFVITRVLNWLAAGVAAVGLISALLAWELERSRELAIIRSLGLTPAGAALLVEAQTGFMGFAALLAALPAGLLTAVVLIDVINRRAFGWKIDLHLTSAQFTNALVLALTAALAAGLYPAWRAARGPIAADIREE